MINLETRFPIAYQSNDHIVPWGTRTSNSNHSYFRFKLLRLFDEKINWSLLDLGCSGGAFVESLHEIGVAAVGLEGSDYSLLNRRGSWPKLGMKRLFTADITKPFMIKLHKETMLFDVVTAWDVLEHLNFSDLSRLFENINFHLKDSGICIFSIATVSDVIDGVELHKTILHKSEWEQIFVDNGFERVFNIEEYLCGHSARGKRFNELTGFNVVLKKKDAATKAINPPTGIFEKIADRFVGSGFQKRLKILVTGD